MRNGKLTKSDGKTGTFKESQFLTTFIWLIYIGFILVFIIIIPRFLLS